MSGGERICECCEDAPAVARVAIHYPWQTKRYVVCEDCGADLTEGWDPDEVEVIGALA